MALYIPHSIFHLERLLYIRPETFGPYYVCNRVFDWFYAFIFRDKQLSTFLFSLMRATYLANFITLDFITQALFEPLTGVLTSITNKYRKWNTYVYCWVHFRDVTVSYNMKQVYFITLLNSSVHALWYVKTLVTPENAQFYNLCILSIT